MKKGQFEGFDPSMFQGCCCLLKVGYDPSLAIFKDKSFHSSSPFLLRQIEYYQQYIDPKLKKKMHVKRMCRYKPTCSEYGRLSIKRHGAVKGLVLTIYRLLRCNPFSKGGYDPVKL